MNPFQILLAMAGYMALLVVISLITGRKSDNATFFTANRNSPWLVVAIGMIGASISGVTFVSVPGKVGFDQWAYLQMVFGYLLGYLVIATVLMPLYYRLNLISIYSYLEQRFGGVSYRTGAVFFLISRLLGSSLRLYLVALVLQLAVFDPLGLPFGLNVLLSIGLIFVYTFRSGVQTVIWTDMLQTFAFVAGAGAVVWLIGRELNLGAGELVRTVSESAYSQVGHWDWSKGNHFFKQFTGGAFIALTMTGLDQDMMQKNLTCRTLRDAQKNMLTFSAVLVLVNMLFLSLGTLLYVYGEQTGIVQAVFEPGCAVKIADPATGELICRSRTDELFPLLAFNHLGPAVALLFVIGIIAAAYSSADSALTALTTSFCIDLLGFKAHMQSTRHRNIRIGVHIGFALLMVFIVIGARSLNNPAVIDTIFDVATYTYGPLLGLFAFGMLTRYRIRDAWAPLVCLLAVALTYLIQLNSPRWGYTFSFEKLPLNALLTMAGLWVIRTRGESSPVV
ncbi:MAG: sodium:solute symporter [Bacteroidia bacterium]|nr:sodium:solute symporter [Bacteroidia bacterium]